MNSSNPPTSPFKVACVEFNPEFMELDSNITRLAEVAGEAASNGARLIVFPEAAVSGYIYRDRAQFDPYMDTVPGKTTDALEQVCAKHGCYVAVGIAEKDPDTGLAYNTGALVGPQGFIGKYRKAGLNPDDQLWFAPGNTGFPVFETELGGITMIICYDDTYWESARMAALKGADIIAYICSSDRVLPSLGAESSGNHSTIAAVQQLCAWNGLAMVAADRNNAETNPTTGVTVTYGGSASIWQATGERVAHAPATSASTSMSNPGQILYAELDPARFDNDQKATLAKRRPELYTDLQFYRVPTDFAASTHSHPVNAVALQYGVGGDFAENLARAEAQLSDLDAGQVDLLVLPAYSFCGAPRAEDTQEQIGERAEAALGRSVQAGSDFAARLQTHVVVSFIERGDGGLHHTAALIAPNGTVIGYYRQTHLADDESWATPGDDLPVFSTAIGRIGLLLNSDVRFPEASGVLAVRRADIIAIPTRWDGSYGGPLHDAGGLFAEQYPANTMCLWYAIAKTAQAYTVVANSIGDGAVGSSGIFTINPVDSLEAPVTGSETSAGAVRLSFHTLGDPSWWMSQARMLTGRRVDLTAPAVFPMDSAAFAAWRDAPGYRLDSWAAYDQGADH